MEKYRNSCGTSSLNRSYPLPTSRFLNTGPLYTMGSFPTNLQQQQQQQQGPQLLMNTNSVGTATQFQFVPARHQHTANNFSATPFPFDIGNSIAPLVNSVKTFFSNLLKPTIRTDTTYGTVIGGSSEPATETRKCNSAPNIYMSTMSDSKCAGDFEKSCFVDKVDYEMLSKLSSSTKSFSDYNLPISAVKSSSYCNSNHNITQPADKVPEITKKSVQRQEQQQPIPLQHTTKESNVKISPTLSPVANPQVTPNAISISSINIPTVPIMTRKCDKKRPKKEKSGKKAKRRSGKNQKEKGKHALALNIHEDCETETMSTDEWDEPLVIISASSTETTTLPSVQSSSDPITFSTDDFPAMPSHCPTANIQTLPRLSHCVAALIGKRPQRQISECDSEDSFIVFDNDDKQTPSSVESNLSFCDRIRNRLSMGGRQRQISESSDDDFICFEMEGSDADGDDNDGDDDDEDDGSDCDEEALTSVSDCESEVDVKSSGTNPPDSGFEDKKVRFNLKPVVHVLRTWRFAYQQARKGEWEQYGRDRVRFYDRIKRLESTLAPILNSDHRQRIYCERFLQTAVNDSGVQGSAIDKQ